MTPINSAMLFIFLARFFMALSRRRTLVSTTKTTLLRAVWQYS